MRTFMAVSRLGFLALAGLVVLLPGIAQQPPKPYQVKIVREKDIIGPGVLPVDLTLRLSLEYKGNMTYGALVEGKRVADCVTTLFMIDDSIVKPMTPKVLQKVGADNEDRPFGGRAVWEKDGIRTSMTFQAVPSKSYQAKRTVPSLRRMDTLLVKYALENNSSVVRKVGCRVVVDNFVIGLPPVRYLSPITHPGRTLLGVTFEKTGVPRYIDAVETTHPTYQTTLTLKLGDSLESPDKVVLTHARGVRDDRWAVPEEDGERPVCVLYWEPRDLLPKAKREFAYAYGEGIALSVEALVRAEFSGSFDPGKLFTITALVYGPFDVQNLTLQLPAGIELVDGRAKQIVPLPSGSRGQSAVMWRCRVLETGTFPIAIRSSNGAIQTWTVTVSPPE